MKKPVFPWGFQTSIAEFMGTSRQYVSGLMNRDYTAGADAAIQLEYASIAADFFISRWDWMNTRATRNPAFVGDPKEEPLDLPKRPRGRSAWEKLPEDRGTVLRIWRLQDAPYEYRRLNERLHLGSDWVAFIPDKIEELPPWIPLDRVDSFDVIGGEVYFFD